MYLPPELWRMIMGYKAAHFNYVKQICMYCCFVDCRCNRCYRCLDVYYECDCGEIDVANMYAHTCYCCSTIVYSVDEDLDYLCEKQYNEGELEEMYYLKGCTYCGRRCGYLAVLEHVFCQACYPTTVSTEQGFMKNTDYIKRFGEFVDIKRYRKYKGIDRRKGAYVGEETIGDIKS